MLWRTTKPMISILQLFIDLTPFLLCTDNCMGFYDPKEVTSPESLKYSFISHDLTNFKPTVMMTALDAKTSSVSIGQIKKHGHRHTETCMH